MIKHRGGLVEIGEGASDGLRNWLARMWSLITVKHWSEASQELEIQTWSACQVWYWISRIQRLRRMGFAGTRNGPLTLSIPVLWAKDMVIVGMKDDRKSKANGVVFLSAYRCIIWDRKVHLVVSWVSQ
jgi:hypothetical protein